MTVNDLPPEAQVAIGYASPEHRGAFASLLAFDRNLARSVAGASEAIVGQLRLAWWRDALAASADDLPRGNPLLDELAAAFGEQRRSLRALVDGWEAVLLAEPVWVAIQALSERAAGWRSGPSGADDPTVRLAAGRWALADLSGCRRIARTRRCAGITGSACFDDQSDAPSRRPRRTGAPLACCRWRALACRARQRHGGVACRRLRSLKIPSNQEART